MRVQLESANFEQGSAIVEAIHEFFLINRTIVLFVYGLTFFVMGLVIFVDSRRHSRLRLARDLRWLAAFGVLHGMHEWGDIFIPIQAEYLSQSHIGFLWTLQVVFLAVSFMCLLMFGAVTLESQWSQGRVVVIVVGSIWCVYFLATHYTIPDLRVAHRMANIAARYLLCFPGSLLAAYGLRHQARTSIAPLNIGHIYRTLRIAGWALLAYGIFAGLFVRSADFFPANTLNRELVEKTIGLPIEVLRSTAGLVLAVAIIRALEVFEIEIDQLIEKMEVENIQAAERERIGQEIHDGAVQGVYSASLILESMQPLIKQDSEAERRLQQARSVLNDVNMDLRNYMVSLRTESPPDPLIHSLQTLIGDPRFQGLLTIELDYAVEPIFKPMQVHHIVAIVQESLSNTLRHARAHKAKIAVKQMNGSIAVHIADDGRGFSSQSTSASYGVRSMRDRARLLGGQLEIESIPGNGTKVVLTLPEEKP